MKLKITILIGLLMSLAFVGCSSDNEPEQDQLLGEEMYNLLLGTITTPEGEITFSPISEDFSQRGMLVYGEEQSKQFCEVLLMSSWDGNNIIRTLADGYGSLSISNSDEPGVFHVINFNLKDLTPFTLKLATAEYFNNDNLAVHPGGFKGTRYWKCKLCGYMKDSQWGIPHPCPKCKNDKSDQWTSVMSGSAPLF